MKKWKVRRKGSWKVTSSMWGGKWRKLMENEENRGHINRKASKHQLVPFVNSILEISLYSLSLSLSLSLTLGHIEFSWSTLALDQERKWRQRGRKDKERKSGIKQLQWVYLQLSIHMCYFLARFGMHGYACVFLVFLLSLAWVFLGVTKFFNLAFPFMDSHGVMGFSCFSWVGFSDGFKAE